MHPEVAQIVERICAPDLAEVDDATIVTLILVDMRYIKVAMRELCLFAIQPAIKLIDDLMESNDFALIEDLHL